MSVRSQRQAAHESRPALKVTAILSCRLANGPRWRGLCSPPACSCSASRATRLRRRCRPTPTLALPSRQRPRRVRRRCSSPCRSASSRRSISIRSTLAHAQRTLQSVRATTRSCGISPAPDFQARNDAAELAQTYFRSETSQLRPSWGGTCSAPQLSDVPALDAARHCCISRGSSPRRPLQIKFEPARSGGGRAVAALWYLHRHAGKRLPGSHRRRRPKPKQTAPVGKRGTTPGSGLVVTVKTVGAENTAGWPDSVRQARKRAVGSELSRAAARFMLLLSQMRK